MVRTVRFFPPSPGHLEAYQPEAFPQEEFQDDDVTSDALADPPDAGPADPDWLDEPSGEG